MLHFSPANARTDHSAPPSDLDRRVSILIDLVAVADRETRGPRVAIALAECVLRAFDELVHAFDAHVRANPSDAARLGAKVQTALLPLMRRAENGYRWYAKPRGYAGDYLTIARMYDDVARGEGPVAELLDRCFLRLPAVLAVQNRRALITDELRTTIRNSRDTAHVTTLACGPARELFDLYSLLDEPRVLHATLIDFDASALAHCHQEVRHLGIESTVDVHEANLIHVATGRRSLPVADQDLVYSIGLVDYFDDALVIQLLDWIHTILRPGGRVVLGNIHPRNPTRAVMDHVLEWRLHHRDEADMHALYEASAFGRSATRIAYEPQRINLFAECQKA